MQRNLSIIALVYLVGLLFVVGCTPEALTDKNAFQNPLLESGADPWAIYHDGLYYYIKSDQSSFTLMKTKDITDLRNAQKKVIWDAPKNTDHSNALWAPEIHNIDGVWYIYYAADNGDHLNHRMFVLENKEKDPFDGTFTHKSRLKTDPNDNWAIDGSIFKHKNQLYFIFSGWETPKVTVETQRIYIAKMSNPWTISSNRVLLNTPEYDWEKMYDYSGTWNESYPIYVNEGPQILTHGNKVHLVYSCSGCWTPYYKLGMLTTTTDSDLMDLKSWIKSEKPVFQQSIKNNVYATGHNSFFKSPDGKEDWILYHANDNPGDGCGTTRSPRAQKIEWDNQGFPIFGEPIPTSQKIRKPSGIR